MQYYEQEPFGEERADLRAGIVTANIVNMLILANADPKRRPKLHKPSDFIPKFGKAKRVKMMDQADWSDFKAMMIATAH